MPALRATWMTMGIITATTGVLFMMAEATQTKANIAAMVISGWVSAREDTIRLRWSSAPVRRRPPMMMNMKAMVQGALLDSTPTASSKGASPSTSISAATPTAITSGGWRSRTNITNIRAMMTRVVMAAVWPVNAMPNMRETSCCNPR